MAHSIAKAVVIKHGNLFFSRAARRRSADVPRPWVRSLFTIADI